MNIWVDFFFQAEDGIRDDLVTGVQTCALPILKRALYLETTKRQQAQADKAYDIQTNIMQQQVVAEQVKVQQIEKEQQVKVQEAEINRREKELIATVLKVAEMERQRIETLAAAHKQRLIAEAEAQAS